MHNLEPSATLQANQSTKLIAFILQKRQRSFTHVILQKVPLQMYQKVTKWYRHCLAPSQDWIFATMEVVLPKHLSEANMRKDEEVNGSK